MTKTPRVGASGGSGGNKVQRSFAAGDGTMWAVMKDGTTRQLVDQNKRPIKSADFSRFKGQVYLGAAKAFEDNPAGAAEAAAGAIYPESSGSVPTGLPSDAKQIGTKGGKKVYEYTDPVTRQKKRVMEQ